MFKSFSLPLAFASAAFVSLSSPVFALDGADMAAKLNAAFAVSGAKLDYSGVQVDGTTVTINSVKFSGSGDSSEALALGDIVFSGVKESDTGGYDVETVKFMDVDYSDAEKNGVTVRAIAIDGLVIPGKADPSTLDGSVLYTSAHTGPISIRNKGVEVVLADSIESTMSIADDQSTVDTTLKLTGLKADMTQDNDPKTKELVEKLELQTITGDVNLEGSWEIATGKIDVSTFAIDLAKIGRLEFAFTLSGYTTDFIKGMNEAIKLSNENADKAAGQQAMGMSMMGLMQQLTFEGALIRFDDASITQRLLAYFGQQQGMSAEDMAKSLSGMIPIMMAQLNVPDLQNQVTEAANTFLADPKSVEISALPEKPVPFPQIMGAAMGAPTSIPALLGVTVTANQEE
ncbi:MAG: hypothetical protein RIR97_1065 [Pseudomonadota bacterium]